MDVGAAAQLLASGEVVALDVREPAEWAAARIPGALHIPIGELAQRAGELSREATIVAVCRSGNRSGLVVHGLRQAGFRANLEGGMREWARVGLPLEPHDGRIA
jgi:rhodanese-related sulfurtransferase